MDGVLDMLRVTLFGSSNDAKNGTAAAFDAAKDIPSLASKVVLITGAAGSLGRQTAMDLARHGRPARIYVADLPSKRGEVEAPEFSKDVAGSPTEFRFLDLDLASLESVRACAASFLAQEDRLDILILNAGLLRIAPATTKDGYEQHIGINYLGHALLSRLLTPKLLHTQTLQPDADVRVVVVSSEGHVSTPKGGVDFDLAKTDCANMHYAKRYGQSKLALIGLAKELARAHPQIKTVAIHPGRILTGMARSLQKESTLAWATQPLAPLFCVPIEVGIRNHLWAATSPDVVSGAYYEPVGVPGTLSALAQDDAFHERLRVWTDDVLSSVKPIE